MNAQGVEYLVIGGWAFSFHSTPRYTGDFDFFVRCAVENESRLRRVLVDFGFGDLRDSSRRFLEQGQVFRFGRRPTQASFDEQPRHPPAARRKKRAENASHSPPVNYFMTNTIFILRFFKYKIKNHAAIKFLTGGESPPHGRLYFGSNSSFLRPLLGVPRDFRQRRASAGLFPSKI